MVKNGKVIHGNTKPGVARSIEIACKRLSWNALKVLEKILNDDSADPKYRLEAAKEIFSRGWGRPKQQIEAQVNVGGGDVLLGAIAEARKRVEAARELPPPTPEQIEKEINSITH